jgi:hypothetical protein
VLGAKEGESAAAQQQQRVGLDFLPLATGSVRQFLYISPGSLHPRRETLAPVRTASAGTSSDYRSGSELAPAAQQQQRVGLDFLPLATGSVRQFLYILTRTSTTRLSGGSTRGFDDHEPLVRFIRDVKPLHRFEPHPPERHPTIAACRSLPAVSANSSTS